MALTKLKRAYADARLGGMSQKDSALAAGCPEKNAKQRGYQLERDPDVQSAMGRTVAVQTRQPAAPKIDPDPYIPAPSDDPKLFLQSMMNDLTAEPRFRLDAAKALLPYVHGKVAEAGKKDAKDAAAKEVSRGKFAAGAPPLKIVK